MTSDERGTAPAPEKDSKPRSSTAALDAIRSKVRRMTRARRERDSFWQHVLHLGVVGWMFVLPALAGAFTGRFVAQWTGSRAAAVGPLALGLIVGAYAVWRQLRSSWDENGEQR